MAVSLTRFMVLGLVLGTLSCSGSSKAPLADQLDTYTDKGNGCQESVSAVAYADGQLRAMGQESFQEFTDAVRSSISAVSGTIALEVRDFPSKDTLDQARRVADLADEVAAADTRGVKRVRLLRQYRVEAEQLVIACSRAVKGI